VGEIGRSVVDMGRKISLRKVGTGFVGYKMDEKWTGSMGLKRSAG